MSLGVLVILGWLVGPVGRNNVAFPLSLEFIFGMTMESLIAKAHEFAKSVAAVAIIFGFLAIGLSQELGLISGGKDAMRVLVWGVPAAFVVAGATLAQWIWRPLMKSAGGVARRRILRPVPLPYAAYFDSSAGFGYGQTSWPIVLAICIIVSISIHFLIERPIFSWFKSKPSERNPAVLTPRVGGPARLRNSFRGLRPGDRWRKSQHCERCPHDLFVSGHSSFFVTG